MAHPLLIELSLDSGEALHILDYLLTNNEVSPEMIRKAYHLHTKSSHDTSTVQKKKQKKKQTPPIDDTLVRRRHIALLIYYDGKKYSGLAENVGVPGDNSVERALFAALQKSHLATNRQGYSRSGRTDRGVSAAGQVVALPLASAFCVTASAVADHGPPLTNEELPRRSDTSCTVWTPNKRKPDAPWQHKDVSEYAYDKILNNLLPPDIRVLGWAPVTNEFSARFSTSSRTYRYFFIRKWLDEDRMRDGIQRMVGQHDFSNFCKMNIEEVSNFVRIIHHAEVCAVDENVGYFLIHGQAFLWHQIRCIASVLFLIGKKCEEPSIVSELLDVEKHPGKPSYPLADEQHLVLHQCTYQNLSFGFSAPNLWGLTMHLQGQWEEHILMAARIRNTMDCVLLDADVSACDVYEFAVAKQKHRKKRQAQSEDSVSSFPTRESLSCSTTLTWQHALQWLEEKCQLRPDPDVTRDFSHTPLLQRSMGTSYQEKVACLLNSTSSKRQQRFHENQRKKSKTEQEDDDFYQTKLRQGSSTM